jgi:hypothetical protein
MLDDPRMCLHILERKTRFGVENQKLADERVSIQVLQKTREERRKTIPF